MLKLLLTPEEYVTINGNIVVQLTRISGRRVYLAVDAARDVPIVRGKVLEREGEVRPTCLTAPPGKRPPRRREQVVCWNKDRERSVQTILAIMDRLDEQGMHDEIRIMRKELEHIIPQVWEGD